MSDEIESVEDFRARARAWIKANLGPVQGWDLSQHCENDEEEREAVALRRPNFQPLRLDPARIRHSRTEGRALARDPQGR